MDYYESILSFYSVIQQNQKFLKNTYIKKSHTLSLSEILRFTNRYKNRYKNLMFIIYIYLFYYILILSNYRDIFLPSY